MTHETGLETSTSSPCLAITWSLSCRPYMITASLASPRSLPLFEVAQLSSKDAGLHMIEFCETTSVVTMPWLTLISSYTAHQALIPTPLLHWYLLNSLMVTRLHVLLQYNRHQCFQVVAGDCVQKHPDAQYNERTRLLSSVPQAVHG